MSYDYYLGPEKLLRVQEEKDLGVIISSKLLWESHIHAIIAKANKLLGLLKRTCPLLTDTKVRRTLCLSLVKSQLCFATEIWSPAHSSLKAKLERVQQDGSKTATRWILKTKLGEISYKDKLLALQLLPLTYDREVKDLVFFYKALYGYIDLNIHDYVSFLSHGRTRLSQNCSVNLKLPLCKTSTFQASYFNRIVKLWNSVCKIALPSSFSSPSSFKSFIADRYFSLVSTVFEADMSCTWSFAHDCAYLFSI